MGGWNSFVGCGSVRKRRGEDDGREGKSFFFLDDGLGVGLKHWGLILLYFAIRKPVLLTEEWGNGGDEDRDTQTELSCG